MAHAKIRVDVNTAGWPPSSHFVELSAPLKRFDPETGTPILYDQICVCVKAPDVYGDGGAGVDVFPAALVTESTTDPDTDETTERHTAGFVTDTMIPIARLDHMGLYSAIRQLGYTPDD